MSYIDKCIEKFEDNKIYDKNRSKSRGVFYTPWEIVNFIVSNAYRFYFEDFHSERMYPGKEFDMKLLKHLINEDNSLYSKLKTEISKIKVMDPASGSGRFLISAANFLFNIYRLLDVNQDDFSIKKKIIQEQVYGIDIEEEANVISNLRLANWLYDDLESMLPKNLNSNLKLTTIQKHLSELDVKCNLFNEDFLLDFSQYDFDIILGNPPYIENKKIADFKYKKKLTKKFASAYKLFDLSVVFIEKSINILNPVKGVLSFLTTNKFLASDYGIRIREILLKKTQIRKIIDISSLNSFKHISTYPIILFLKNGKNDSKFLSIQKFKHPNQFQNNKGNQVFSFDQNKLLNFPSFAIPLSENIDLIDDIYSKFKKLSEISKDLKLIYRPFGFIDWVQESKNIIKKSTSSNDMILLGTGNVNRYYIDFKKNIKVAKDNYFRPFFRYNEKYGNIWKELASEKLIFREIARDLTFVYDPGVFVNLTGLYFLKIPSFNTDELFGLLTILNSKILNLIFKSLYGTLHMNRGYLRFNGSFIKSMPIPSKIPKYLSNLGKILHFLSQLKFESNKQIDPKLQKINRKKKIELLLGFYDTYTNEIVNQLYLNNLNKGDFTKNLPKFRFKFILSHYDFPNFECYSIDEINVILDEIYSFYIKFVDNK